MEKLLELASSLDKIQTNLSKLMWVQYTAGYDFGIDKAYKELNDFLASKDNYKLILDYRERDLDFENKRRLEIAYNIFRPHHLSEEINVLKERIQKKTNELSMLLNSFRFTLEGREVSSVEIGQILANEDDRELRKKAYFARNQINKPLVDGGFIDLLNMRKEYALLNGKKDFVEYSLEENELSPAIFDSWREDLKPYIESLNVKRKDYARRFLAGEEMMPWDNAYIMGKIAPANNTSIDMSNYYEVLRDFFMNFNLDLDEYNITYDIFSRKNKSEWGYNFPIKNGVDSRILANVKNKYHEYGVLLHETGHGIHSFLLDPEEILLNAGIPGIITEGIANLFGSFLYDEIFYRNFLDESVKEEFTELLEYQKLNSIRAIGDIFFDQELYRRDIKSLEDIYQLYFETFKDLYGDEPFEEEPVFGYRIHHTTHPIYLHNYFMGDVTCEMLKKAFCKRQGIGSISERTQEFSDFLIKEVINPAGLYKYEELFERISGEKFSLKFYLE